MGPDLRDGRAGDLIAVPEVPRHRIERNPAIRILVARLRVDIAIGIEIWPVFCLVATAAMCQNPLRIE